MPLLSHFLLFPRMLWGLPTGRPSIFSPGGAVEVSSVAQALPDVSRTVLSDSKPASTCFSTVFAAKTSFQLQSVNLIEDKTLSSRRELQFSRGRSSAEFPCRELPQMQLSEAQPGSMSCLSFILHVIPRCKEYKESLLIVLFHWTWKIQKGLRSDSYILVTT